MDELHCWPEELSRPFLHWLWSDSVVSELQGGVPSCQGVDALQERYARTKLTSSPSFSLSENKLFLIIFKPFWKVCMCLCVSHPLPFISSRPTDTPFEIELKTLSEHNVSISWRKSETARQQAGYVVEWYPEGHKPEELRWVRLGRKDSSAVITGGKNKPHKCVWVW